MGQQPLCIVEHPPDAQAMLKNALRQAGVENPIRHFSCETEARVYLFPEDPSIEPRPALIFLQGLSTEKSGFDLLQCLRQHPSTRYIPIIMILEPEQLPWVYRCYQHGAHSVVLKDPGKDAFNEKIQWLCQYWLGVCNLPAL